MDAIAPELLPLLTALGGGARRVGADYTIRLTAFNAAASVRLRLSGRYLLEEGRETSFGENLVPTTDRVATTLDLRLGAGWLLGASVRVIGGSPQSGQTFVVLSLGTGSGAAFNELETIAAGDVTSVHRIAWPGSPIRSSLEGAGALRTIAGTTPAAGAEISETVPTGARWELLNFTYTLVTSATVANRDSALVIDDGANVLYTSAAQAVQTASTTRIYHHVQGYGAPFVDSSNRFTSVFPTGLRLAAGYRLRTSTSAIQVGDQYGAPIYTVREWIEGA